MTGADPETVSWVRIVLAFTVVFALLIGLGFALRYIKDKGLVMPGREPSSAKRLQIVESLAVDMKRRLVIVRCDGDEHLLLLGPDRDIVVDNCLNKNQTSSRLKSIA